MTLSMVLDIGTESVLLVLMITGPLLFAALIVGLMVGVFQAVTQINEMTLTFIPKILSVFGVLLFLLPWMVTKITEFTIHLFDRIPDLIR